MLYSKSAHAAGGSGFFFDDDRNAPADCVEVSDADVFTAINLPLGSTYDFDANGVLTHTDPSDAFLLAQAQAAQLALMVQAYQAAIAQDITFRTAAGVSRVFQADPQSISNAQAMIAAYGTSGVPSGFYWVAKDNTQVPFTTADLQGLAKAMGDQGWAEFQTLQSRKASIRAAATVAAVQAITWS